MKNRISILSFLLIWTLSITLILVSCSEERDILTEAPSTNTDYIIFGSYFGFTATGRPDVDIFLLTSNGLSKDVVQQYPGNESNYQGSYSAMGLDDFQKVKFLLESDFNLLLVVQDTVLGCPDCADGGGLYLELKQGSTHRFWLIDRTKYLIAEELHPIIDELDSTVRLIR